MIGTRYRALLLLALLAPPLAGAKDTRPAKAPDNPLVGTWRLVRYVDTARGGQAVHAFGTAPIGQFVFTRDGHISVHIMHNPPAPKDAPIDPDPDACVPGWYCGYFGTYTFNAKDNSWVTHVTGGNIPSYVGTDQKRKFTIQGRRLVITETYLADGVQFDAERVLERDSGAR